MANGSSETLKKHKPEDCPGCECGNEDCAECRGWTCNGTQILDAAGRCIAWVGWGRGSISMKVTPDEQIAHAKLLTSAPALRESVETLAELIETFYGGKESAMCSIERKALKVAYALLEATAVQPKAGH